MWIGIILGGLALLVLGAAGYAAYAVRAQKVASTSDADRKKLMDQIASYFGVGRAAASKPAAPETAPATSTQAVTPYVPPAPATTMPGGASYVAPVINSLSSLASVIAKAVGSGSSGSSGSSAPVSSVWDASPDQPGSYGPPKDFFTPASAGPADWIPVDFGN